MHTIQLGDDTCAFHNGDYSGTVIFQGPDIGTSLVVEGEFRRVAVELPFEAIEKLVLEKYRSEAVSRLEEADYEDLRIHFLS